MESQQAEMKGEIDLGGGECFDEIHQVPCCIKYNGPSPVSDYFIPKPTGASVKEAHFRGRKLQGITQTLPIAYSGFVIGKKTFAKRKASDPDPTGGTTTCWQTKARFQNITLWNHDNLPSNENAFLRAFHWFDVAKALHKPVTVADMDSASNPGAIATD